ncbi:MAG: hypothetical protein IJW03_05085 [Clostridia bacterium]|nr:hypothetical protein [Clostridia bacterium]
MNNTVKRSALLSSVITVALCLSLITGATFALFTDTTTVNIAVTAANVDVTAAIAEDSIQTLSIGDSSVRTDGSFENGGQAQIDGANLKLSLMTPGDIAKFTIEVTNSSNIKIKYKVCMVSNTV